MNMLGKCGGSLMLLAAAMFCADVATAGEYNDGLSVKYYDTLKGKKVAFMPVSMGMGFIQGIYVALKRQADALGYEIIVRDPNWNVDAGAQALSQLIDEKPDIIIVQNVDTQAYNKLVKKANEAGIYVIQYNMKTPNNGDVLVGGIGIKCRRCKAMN
jgi:ribose transport system substrate-binding protein